jgi:molybdopterin molybdotransferase
MSTAAGAPGQAAGKAAGKGPLNLIAAVEARRRLAVATPRVAVREDVPLAAAPGRVLAAAIVAPEDAPAFARSGMDGFAVRSGDVAGASEAAPVWLDRIGAVVMGQPPDTAVASGQAMEIATGACVPDGADAVVMVEHTVVDAGGGATSVGIKRPVGAGGNVIRIGEDIRRGTAVLEAGRRLRPADVGALAAFGITRVPVFARPRVAVLSTGPELCAPDAAPPPGKIRDVNQYALAARAAAAGCLVTPAGIVDDDPAALERALADLSDRHDVVMVTGGSSVGGRDFTGDVFARLAGGGVLFAGIDIRPGKPTVVAKRGETLLIGLPGVPLSALVVFEAFIAEPLRLMGGEAGRAEAPRRARLGRDVSSVAGREDWVRVRLASRDGETWAQPLLGGSATFFSTLVAADALLAVPAEVETMRAGEWVSVHVLG